MVRLGKIAVAVLASVAVASSGCGQDRVRSVALLQMTQPTVVQRAAQDKKGQASSRVRASLPAPATPASAAPAINVPQVGSIAVGAPNQGRLVNGIQLPASGPDWMALSAPANRWTTDRMLSFVLSVLRAYRLANPTAPAVMIGDLSLPYGGRMGGHVSHQNGLDADIYYPRLDRTLQAPTRVRDVDRSLAQDLVSRFAAAGAQFAFVGLHVGLGGPPGIVQAIANHDDHFHVRIANVAK